jgi:cyclohexanone monooxygenase
MELLGIGIRRPSLLRAVELVAKLHLRRSVPDRALRDALTPRYTIGCKRILMSNDYYRALAKPNVSVHPLAVSEVRENSVIGADGREVPADVIVFATGFHITDLPVAEHVFDAEGRSLNDVWQGSPQAYLGTTIAGFPNLFVLLGPNLGTGHTSAFMVVESQLNYVMSAVRAIRRSGWTRVSVRPDVQRTFNATVQDALAGTVYNNGGCTSYYLDVNGRNSFSWPWSTPQMRRRVREFDVGDYTVEALVNSPRPADPVA